MKILFTCGGTAGHINPAIALARRFEERHPGCEILFVGAEGGMEAKLVPQEGFQFATVPVGDLWRGFSWRFIKHNIKTAVGLPGSNRKAGQLVAKFQPDLVVGTGGYVSYPVVRMAAKMGIPTAIHESNAVPGLTTKMLAKLADVIMVGFAGVEKSYPKPERVVVTGTPVRPDFYKYTKQEARAQLGLTDDRPLVLSYWGSLGAGVMNGYMADFIARELRDGAPFHHIHGAGRGYDTLMTALHEKGVTLQHGVEVRPYIYDMPLIMAAADLVLCRTGAATLAELSAVGKPAIMVPSPYVTNNHQEKNARVVEKSGGGVVMLEPDCTGKTLYDQTATMLKDQPAMKAYSQHMAAMTIGEATETIYQTLMALIRSEK